MTYEDRWNAYVARIEKEHGPIAPSDAEIKHLKEGDEHLFELGQRRLRRASKPTPEEDEQRRWIYDCAVIGDTIADGVEPDRWRCESRARPVMLQELSDRLGVHYLGREAHRMPHLRFVQMSDAGSYCPRTRQIEISCQRCGSLDHLASCGNSQAPLALAYSWVQALRLLITERTDWVCLRRRCGETSSRAVIDQCSSSPSWSRV